MNELIAIMEEIQITGLVSRRGLNYVIITDERREYQLSAIKPWEAVSPDYGTDQFELHLGKRMIATGLTDGHTIYRAVLVEVSWEKIE